MQVQSASSVNTFKNGYDNWLHKTLNPLNDLELNLFEMQGMNNV